MTTLTASILCTSALVSCRTASGAEPVVPAADRSSFGGGVRAESCLRATSELGPPVPIERPGGRPGTPDSRSTA